MESPSQQVVEASQGADYEVAVVGAQVQKSCLSILMESPSRQAVEASQGADYDVAVEVGAQAQKIRLSIMPPSGEDGKPITYNLPTHTPLRKIVKKLCRKHGLDDTKGMKLMKGRKRLNPSLTVAQAGLKNGDKLDAYYTAWSG